jgi:hypothetical protein
MKQFTVLLVLFGALCSGVPAQNVLQTRKDMPRSWKEHRPKPFTVGILSFFDSYRVEDGNLILNNSKLNGWRFFLDYEKMTSQEQAIYDAKHEAVWTTHGRDYILPKGFSDAAFSELAHRSITFRLLDPDKGVYTFTEHNVTFSLGDEWIRNESDFRIHDSHLENVGKPRQIRVARMEQDTKTGKETEILSPPEEYIDEELRPFTTSNSPDLGSNTKAKATSDTTASDKAQYSTSPQHSVWLVWALVIVAAIGLLWLLLKKRK